MVLSVWGEILQSGFTIGSSFITLSTGKEVSFSNLIRIPSSFIRSLWLTCQNGHVSLLPPSLLSPSYPPSLMIRLAAISCVPSTLAAAPRGTTTESPEIPRPPLPNPTLAASPHLLITAKASTSSCSKFLNHLLVHKRTTQSVQVVFVAAITLGYSLSSLLGREAPKGNQDSCFSRV